MEFQHYRLMMAGCSIALFLFLMFILLLISKRLLAELAEKFLDIIRLDHRTLIMDFFGRQIDLKASRRFRLSIIIQLADMTSIIFLLLLDGCSMQVHYLSNKDTCPGQMTDCFTYGKSSTHERVICPPGQTVANTSSSNIVCFVWVYAEQNALSILNQIGIGSSVFSLLCHTFKMFCRMSRKWWGFLLIIFLILASESIIITALIIDLSMSMTAKLLLFALSCILINVIQLRQFTHSYQSPRSLVLLKT